MAIETQGRRNQWLAAHPADSGWADDLVQRIDARTGQLGADAARCQPAHLIELLGPLPEDDSGQRRWQQLAGHLESYRQRWRLHPDQLGRHTPAPGVQARNWDQLTRAVIAASRPQSQSTLARHHHHDRVRERGGEGIGL